MPNFKEITPDRALQYLQEKPKYFAIWKQIVPYIFEAKGFCDIINTIRIKRIEEAEKIHQQIQEYEGKEEKKKILAGLKQKKKTLFVDTLDKAFTDKIIPVIKNSDISYKEVKQLMGSLSNITKSKKEQIQEITEGVNEEIQESLDMEVYEEEILMTMDDLIHQFIEGAWGSINEGERKWFGQQALDVFIQAHKKNIEKGLIDIRTFTEYLYKKKVF